MFAAITAAVATSTNSISDVLTNNLSTIFSVFGALVALNLVIRLIKRLIGRRA